MKHVMFHNEHKCKNIGFLEFERALKEEMAGTPVMSQARLVFAEMLVLCMTYRELLERKSGTIRREGFGDY